MNYREQFYEGEIDGKTLLDVIDEKEAEVQALRDEVAVYEDCMRSLACQLGAGGFNAEQLTAAQLVEKAQWGINNLTETQWRLLDEVRSERDELRARVVVPGNLLERCREILEWQATGILKGDALRSYCQSKIWGGDPSALRMGEGETAQEAYRFIDELARLNGKAVSEELLRRIAAPRPSSIGEEPAWRLDQGKAIEELSALLGEGKEVDDVPGA